MGQVFVRASGRAKAYTRGLPNRLQPKMHRLDILKSNLHHQAYKKGRTGISKRLNAVTRMRDAERQSIVKREEIHIMGR
jgi:hypothetical protein